MGPFSTRFLRDLRSEIERRSLSSGGWPSGNGPTAGVESTCYGLIALHDHHAPAREKAINLLLRTQNRDGSWPAFEGDDQEGCWVTALAVMTLRFVQSPTSPVEKALHWLLNNKGREGHWLWKWKFRTVDRRLQVDPGKYGWSWFPGTVSWVIPTAFSLIALKQSLPCWRPAQIATRIQLGTEMLFDRACPGGGWNAGNGIVNDAALTPHIDTTAVALLALAEERTQPAAVQALDWLPEACVECSSAYSLAWSAFAFLMHKDLALDGCIADLRTALFRKRSISNVETLSLAAIAINAAEGNANPFQW